jgi:predicted ABC-type ATPase
LDFAFETTLSGIAHASRLNALRARGYDITIIFIKLNSTRLAKWRVAQRVRTGGHNVSAKDIERRFDRGLKNFQEIHKPLADSWVIYNNSSEYPRLEESGP